MTDLIGHMLGLYEIIEEIGHGGMADVYRAVQPSIGRHVAVKVLPAHFLQDRTFLERFSREVQVIARLQHPRILPIYDFGQHEGLPYIVMAYMPGGTLATRIRESGNGLPLDETVRLTEQIAEGLDFAHRQGVIHRDFKPSNVLLDTEGNAYLADFGVAKVTEATAQLTGSGIVGTPAYMAPEMARVGGVSSLVDVYALATTLYQMLTGQLPYQADTPMGVLMAHASMPIPDVRELRPDLSEEVQRVIELGMAKEPMDRYQSAGEIAAGLREAARMPSVAASDALTADVEAPPVGAMAPDDLGATLPAAAHMPVPAEGVDVPSLPHTEQRSPTASTPQRRKASAWLWGIGAVIAALALGGGLFALWPSLTGGDQPTDGALAGDKEATKAPAATPVPAPGEPVEVHWFVGVGGGSNPDQIGPQRQVVDAFNASHPNIRLVLEIIPEGGAVDELRARMASGEAPDIVGPVGVEAMNNFYGEWYDLAPLMEETGYDTSDFDPVLINLYKIGPHGEQVGIPFEIYPSALWYNVDIFDAAGLPYPPRQYGAPYADGAPWNVDKLHEIAMRLTLDTSGRDATNPSFDAGHIAQFGFDAPWSSFRGQATMFGAGSLVDEQGNAVIPLHWRSFWNWYYDGMWRERFIPTSEYLGSDAFVINGFGANGFGPGKVAMIPINIWYTCCVGSTVRWDVAAMPAYAEKTTARLHADTFGILSSTQHPREAFEVLTYLVGEGAPDLLGVYFYGFPARRSLQGNAIARYNEEFPSGVDWEIFLEGLKHYDNPSHESYLPNFEAAQQRMIEFVEFSQGTPGLDMDAELNRLRDDLQGIFEQK